MAPPETGDELVFFVNGKKVRKIPAFCLACSWAVADYIFLFSSWLFPPLKFSKTSTNALVAFRY